MLKLDWEGKEYRIGYNRKLGYLVYDPTVNENTPADTIRLFVIAKNKMSTFKKHIILNKLVPDEELNENLCMVMLRPYAYAKRKQRHTHCYKCKQDINSIDFSICKKCGWILCTCGACGCNYDKT